MDTEMKRRPKRLHDCLKAHRKLAANLLINNVSPMGSGTRGVVYATVYPDVVVKISKDEREVVVAKRLQKMAHPRIVKVYSSFVASVGDSKIVFTYLERMNPLSPLRKAAQEHFHKNFKFSYHKPKTILAALERAITERKAPAEFIPHLREYRSLLNDLLDAGEWHRDLKTPNLMLDKKGVLCVTDIGSFTEEPLVVIRHPPVLIEHLNPLIKKIRKAGHSSLANKLERIAKIPFVPKRPLENLGIPDPHADDSELDDLDFDHFVPEELIRDPAPNGPKWRHPARSNDIKRQTRTTTDTTIQRWKMNGDAANRYPIPR